MIARRSHLTIAFLRSGTWKQAAQPALFDLLEAALRKRVRRITAALGYQE